MPFVVGPKTFLHPFMLLIFKYVLFVLKKIIILMKKTFLSLDNVLK